METAPLEQEKEERKTVTGKPYKYPLVNGKRIHFRRFQMTLWGAILGVVFGAAFVAGLYWIILQQAYPGGLSLKNWWDGGMGIIHSGNWSLYRHSIRNQIEPAAGTILVLSFLFGVKANGKQQKVHSIWTLITLGVTLLAVAVAGAVGETWIIYFGIPGRLHHPLEKFQEIALAAILGIILGKALHYIWRPAAATVQYHLLDGPASRGKTPLWVRFAMAPPTLRERFADLQEKLADKKVTAAELGDEGHSGWFRVAVSLAIFVFFVIAVIGNLARYAIPKGVNIPGMHS